MAAIDGRDDSTDDLLNEAVPSDDAPTKSKSSSDSAWSESEGLPSWGARQAAAKTGKISDDGPDQGFHSTEASFGRTPPPVIDVETPLIPPARPQPAVEDQQPKWRSILPIAVLAALIGALVAGGIVFVVGGNLDRNETVAPSTTLDEPKVTVSGDADVSVVAPESPEVVAEDPEPEPEQAEAIELPEGEPEVPFEFDSLDELGHPIPRLPEVLVPNTPNPAALPGYAERSERAPAIGPYVMIKESRFYLRGTIKSENLRQYLIGVLYNLVPPAAVVIEVEIDESDEWFANDRFPVLIEDAILFGINDTQVTDEFNELAVIGSRVLENDPGLSLRLTGYADNVGDEEYNLALSKQRAEAVADVFRAQGNPERVVVVAKGESDPVATNDTEEGRNQNRRVEFEYFVPDSE